MWEQRSVLKENLGGDVSFRRETEIFSSMFYTKLTNRFLNSMFISLINFTEDHDFCFPNVYLRRTESVLSDEERARARQRIKNTGEAEKTRKVKKGKFCAFVRFD